MSESISEFQPGEWVGDVWTGMIYTNAQTGTSFAVISIAAWEFIQLRLKLYQLENDIEVAAAAAIFSIAVQLLNRGELDVVDLQGRRIPLEERFDTISKFFTP